MELYENISGARMHAALYRPLYKNKTISSILWNKILFYLKNIPKTVTEINTLLLNNLIWKNRLKNIGLIQKSDINQYSLSGILARSIDYKTDLRVVDNSYGYYKYIKIKNKSNIQQIN